MDAAVAMQTALRGALAAAQALISALRHEAQTDAARAFDVGLAAQRLQSVAS